MADFKSCLRDVHPLRRLHTAGVPLLCGTESGFSLTPLGDWHYRELVRASGLQRT